MAVAAVALPLDSEGPAAAAVHFAARADAVSLRLPQADPPCQLPASPSSATNPVWCGLGDCLRVRPFGFSSWRDRRAQRAGDQPDC